VFIYLAFLPSLSFSQTSKDTLLQKIKSYTKQDSLRVELLVDACVANVFKADTLVLRYAMEANYISNKINYPLGIIRSYNCIGNYYYQKGVFDKSIDCYTKAIKIAEKRKDIRNIIISKSNIANVLTHTNKQRQAILIYKECDTLLLINKDSSSQNRAAVLTNLATAYSSLQIHDSAIYVYNNVYEICKAQKIVFGIGLTLSNLASEYYAIKSYPNAIKSCKEALVLIEKNKLDFIKVTVYKTLGSCYLAINQIDEGIDFLKISTQFAKEYEDKESLVELYNKLHIAYFKAGDLKNAYSNLSNYSSLKDSVFGMEKEKTITDINIKYETEKKETEIKNLEQQQQIIELQSKRKTILIYSICGFIILIALVTYFIFTRYKTKKQNELLRIQLEEANKTVEAEKKAAESELKALKSQMNPHFIFNALNSIQEQFMYGDKIKANEQMGNFTYLTRQILNVSSKKKITLATEIDIITKYLDLEKMRFSADFNYEISCDKNIDEDYHELPPMLIQPFIENSMKHGLLHKTGEKKININFALDDKEEYIICTISDNGIGRKKSAEIKMNNQNIHSSFSINSIEERLQLFNKELQLKQLIIYNDILDEHHNCIGTKVILLIPLI
jgi:tetratricopeptide (TPR) repeat protein